MAQGLGAGLGRGQVLFPALPDGKQAQRQNLIAGKFGPEAYQWSPSRPSDQTTNANGETLENQSFQGFAKAANASGVSMSKAIAGSSMGTSITASPASSSSFRAP